MSSVTLGSSSIPATMTFLSVPGWAAKISTVTIKFLVKAPSGHRLPSAQAAGRLAHCLEN